MIGTITTLALLLCTEPEQPVSTQLRYAVDSSCPGESDFLQMLERNLGSSVVIDTHATMAVEIDIQRDRGEYQLRFSVEAPEEPADLRALDCDVLVRTAALRASLALAPASAESTPEAIVSTPPQQTAPTPASPSAAPDRAYPAAAGPGRALSENQQQPVPPDSGFDVRVAGGGEFGGAGVHGQVGLAVGWHSGFGRLELRGAYLTPTRYRLDDETGAAIRVQLGLVAAAACLVGQTPQLAIPACLVVEAGVLRGRGLVGERRVTHQPWAALLARTGATWWATGALGLFTALEAGPVLVRPGVRLTGVPFGYRAGAITARVWAGVALRPGQSDGFRRRRTR